MYCVMEPYTYYGLDKLIGVFENFDDALKLINSSRDNRSYFIEFREINKVDEGKKVELRPTHWIPINQDAKFIDVTSKELVLLDDVKVYDEVQITALFGQYKNFGDSGFYIFRDTDKDNEFVIGFQPLTFASL